MGDLDELALKEIESGKVLIGSLESPIDVRGCCLWMLFVHSF